MPKRSKSLVKELQVTDQPNTDRKEVEFLTDPEPVEVNDKSYHFQLVKLNDGPKLGVAIFANNLDDYVELGLKHQAIVFAGQHGYPGMAISDQRGPYHTLRTKNFRDFADEFPFVFIVTLRSGAGSIGTSPFG